jgi:phosphoglycolate phosphatase
MALICFDLDGTLVDPLPAVEHCLKLTCTELDLPCPPTSEMAACIGQGSGDLFAALPGMGDPARLSAVLERFWSLFAEQGIVRHRIYDGVLLLLARLKHQGHRLYAVSCKPQRFARQVLHQFDALLAFDDVFGSSPLTPWQAKDQVVAALREQGILQPGGFLVGDRGNDMAAARANGLVPLGVSYGFGTVDELRAGGAERVFATVAELDDWFKETLQGPEIHDSFAHSE